MGKRESKHSRLTRLWRRYEYKHSTLAIVSIATFLLALDTAIVQTLLSSIEGLGLWGVFIAGVMFVSFFTAATAVVILISAASKYDPLTVSINAGAGSIIGDWIILRLFEEKVAYELMPLAKKFGIIPIIRLFRRKIFKPVAFVPGAIFIASPLPDEAGLAMLGITKMPLPKLFAITFLLNSLGVWGIVEGVRLASIN